MNSIHTYIYNKKNQPIGVLAAKPMTANPDLVYIGWSKVNRGAGDKFDKARGVDIAFSRSEKGSIACIPDSIAQDYVQFADRCKRYFKDKKILPAAIF